MRDNRSADPPLVPKLLAIIAVCILVALASIALWLDGAGSDTVPLPGKPATALHEVTVSPGAAYGAKFTNLHGNEMSLGQWAGKLLVVNFWATWCGPCKEEIPILVKLQAKFGDRGLQFVGIAADSQVNVANFAKNIEINYPLLIGETAAIEFSGRLGNRLGLLPHTVMIRPGGELIYNKLGAVTEAELGHIIGKNLPINR